MLDKQPHRVLNPVIQSLANKIALLEIKNSDLEAQLATANQRLAQLMASQRAANE
jgi:phage shock protein A